MKNRINRLEEFEWSDLISEKHTKITSAVNWFQHFLFIYFFFIYIFLSALSGSVSSSAFNSLVSVPVGIVSSTAGWKICAICAN